MIAVNVRSYKTFIATRFKKNTGSVDKKEEKELEKAFEFADIQRENAFLATRRNG